MLRVLLVDDEVRTVRGMHDMIPWAKLGIDDVRTATNGADALSVLRHTAVDILMTDIRMPRMNGIDLAREAVQLYPSISIIFLSALSQFELARNALKLGAIDYVPKPVDDGEVIDVLSRAVDQQRFRRREKEMSADAALLDRVLRDALLGVQETDDVVGRLMGEPFAVGLVVLRPIEAVHDIAAADELASLIIFSSPGSFADSRMVREPGSGMTIACALRDSRAERMWADDALIAVDRSLAEFHADSPPRFAAGITVSGTTASDLEAAYSRAWRAAESCVRYESRSAFRFVDDMLPGESSLREVVEEIGAPVGTTPLVDRLLPLLADLEYAPWVGFVEFATIKQVVVARIVTERSFRVAGYGIANVVERFQRATRVPDLLDVVRALLLVAPEEQTSPTVSRIKRYIDQHLTTRFSLVDAAEHAGISPSYLSALFSREVGITFARYVMQRRIDSAKQALLEEPHLPVSEIAARLGFTDYRYFTRTFRRAEGLTPTEYRRVKHQ